MPVPGERPHGAHWGAVEARRGRSGAASAGAVDEWGFRAVLGVSSTPRVRTQSCCTSGHGLPTRPHAAFSSSSTPGDHQVNGVEKEPHPYETGLFQAWITRAGLTAPDGVGRAGARAG